MDSELSALSQLLNQRNDIDKDIAALINRPAEKGHIGEYVAARIFNIGLHHSAATKASDGYFLDGPLTGKSVNIKYYARQTGLLDLPPGAENHELPDYYLVLTGPSAPAVSSLGMTRPWVIASVFLFAAAPLADSVRALSVKVGIATSVRRVQWEAAMIYPDQCNPSLPVSDGQRSQLALFKP